MLPNQYVPGPGRTCFHPFRVSAVAHICGELNFDEYLDGMMVLLTGPQRPEDTARCEKDKGMFDPLSMAIYAYLSEPTFSFLEGM
jgi:hypothetical protein